MSKHIEPTLKDYEQYLEERIDTKRRMNDYHAEGYNRRILEAVHNYQEHVSMQEAGQ